MIIDPVIIDLISSNKIQQTENATIESITLNECGVILIIALKNIIAAARYTNAFEKGNNPRKTPKVTAIAFPPWNFKKGEKACPAIGAAIIRENIIFDTFICLEAKYKGTNPFKISRTRHNIPGRIPTQCITFAVPGFLSSDSFVISFL